MDEAGAVRFGGRDPAAGQQHAHRGLERDRARQPMHAALERHAADARLRQSELGVLGRDDDVAGQRQLEAAAQREAVHRRDERLGQIMAKRQSAEAARMTMRDVRGARVLLAKGASAPLALPRWLRRLPHVVAGRERAIAGGREDRHAQLGIALVAGPHLVQLVGGGAMERVADLGPVERHDEQVPVTLDAAEPRRVAHATPTGLPRLTPWASSRFCSVAMSTLRGATPDSRLSAAAVPAASPMTITGGISRLIFWASGVAA